MGDLLRYVVLLLSAHAGHNQPGASFRVRWLRAEAAKAAIEKVQSVLLISTTDQTGTWSGPDTPNREQGPR